MPLSNLSTAGLEKLIVLVKKRESLQAELAAVEQELTSAIGGTSTAAEAPKTRKVRGPGRKAKVAKAAPKVAAPAAKPARSYAPVKKGKRGALKESVLAALKSAGPAGIAVKDLSGKLGVKNQNLHVWFSTTGKTVSGLKKTKAGTWAYNG